MFEYERLEKLADKEMPENSKKIYGNLNKVSRQEQTHVGLRDVI